MSFEKLEALGQKERARQEQYKRRIFCCTSTACLSAGGSIDAHDLGTGPGCLQMRRGRS